MSIIDKIKSNNVMEQRTGLLAKNIIVSFVLKGWSALVVLFMVPLTLNCLGVYQNGVWLTISSMLVWIDQMDIGLGNGLRNRLAAHIAHGETDKARMVVSSTLAMLLLIVVPILAVLLAMVYYADIYTFLNVDTLLIPSLRTAVLSAVTLVCMTFVLKFIGNVYMGMQLPAVSNLLLTLGQTVALVATWLLYKTDSATFLSIVIVNTAAPLLVYLLAYPYTFYVKFKQLRPSIACVNLHSVFELGNLGVRFFWLQIASIVQFMTANILISKFFTPEMVTPYQITYRYLSIMVVLFSIVCMPFWNATTDAYERGDMQWIMRANAKMNLMAWVIAVLMVLMVVVSPWIYSVWIGGACTVPFAMTVMMAIYIFLYILSIRYSYFLNGIGALRLQLYMTVMAVVFIPLAWFVSNLTHDIIWFMAVMCFCNVPGLFVNMVQLNKILKGKAKGVWRI